MPLAWHCGHFFFYDGYEEKVEEYTAILENVIDLDSIAGTYNGVLPPNVETTLTLNADGTYLLIQTFKEKERQECRSFWLHDSSSINSHR